MTAPETPAALLTGEPVSAAGHDGTHARYSRGCRCQPCRDAHRVYTRERRKAALAEGALSHGVRNTYDAGCRCDKCVGARRVAYFLNPGEHGAQRAARLGIPVVKR
jgi:hypothetical protein